MTKLSAWFLKFGILLIACTAGILLIRLPQLEGRAVNLTFIQIYSDPFILFTFFASLPFFYALGQIFILIGLLEKKRFFTSATSATLRKIQNSALVLAACTFASQLFIRFITSQNSDDSAGPLGLGFVILGACVAVAASSQLLQVNVLGKVSRKKQ